MQYPDGRILVFAKAPIIGTVKTRLQPVLSAEQCCVLQQELIEHTLSTVIEAQLCKVELWCAPDFHHAFFKQCKNKFDVTLKQQTGENLGERMYQALQTTLNKSDFAILIGTDCPGINKDYLAQACETLASKTRSIVLGPAQDGGYVLIAAREISSTLFTNIEWGSNTVLEKTRIHLRRAELSWMELESLRDIDRPEDLSYFALHYPQLAFLC